MLASEYTTLICLVKKEVKTKFLKISPIFSSLDCWDLSLRGHTDPILHPVATTYFVYKKLVYEKVESSSKS